MAANMCSELANLSTMLKGPALKVIFQNTLLASPIKLTCPADIFDEPKETSEETTRRGRRKTKTDFPDVFSPPSKT